ncbi:hypothetical protein [Pannonibacter tanglangensis]|uniref:Uncharacterized protein n=1 Tax=Pannonibacter tanglangensis TaxID=2750084 RepID=A0ABW9ZH50_9HYPH|nr:hypothetical protein [Pannonibacter sp. XCT-34]NBN64174.1 hypothetical protein [Pannonibacter sp. XCT-34]
MTSQPDTATDPVARAMAILRIARLAQPDGQTRDSKAAYCLLTAFALACWQMHLDPAEIAETEWPRIAADLGRYSLQHALPAEAGHA